MSNSKKIWLYDTTLRDGAQREGISLSVEDKLKIARKLDEIGIPFIEGGWPGCYVQRQQSNANYGRDTKDKIVLLKAL